mmetsp:Transcript_35930/g.61882  ORF Transcript_35930/g.61882 Transcript_35930/m.61882 type:complete len:217 (-) Transcript_35930:1113-1763(-)
MGRVECIVALLGVRGIPGRCLAGLERAVIITAFGACMCGGDVSRLLAGLRVDCGHVRGPESLCALRIVPHSRSCTIVCVLGGGQGLERDPRVSSSLYVALPPRPLFRLLHHSHHLLRHTGCFLPLLGDLLRGDVRHDVCSAADLGAQRDGRAGLTGEGPLAHDGARGGETSAGEVPSFPLLPGSGILFFAVGGGVQVLVFCPRGSFLRLSYGVRAR